MWLGQAVLLTSSFDVFIHSKSWRFNILLVRRLPKVVIFNNCSSHLDMFLLVSVRGNPTMTRWSLDKNKQSRCYERGGEGGGLFKLILPSIIPSDYGKGTNFAGHFYLAFQLFGTPNRLELPNQAHRRLKSSGYSATNCHKLQPIRMSWSEGRGGV